MHAVEVAIFSHHGCRENKETMKIAELLCPPLPLFRCVKQFHAKRTK